MNSQDFDALVEKRLRKCQATLTTKNAEYSSDTDRLHNFKVAARLDGEDPVAALWGMWKKHIVSIIDMKDRMVREPGWVPEPGLIEEKLGDNINYTLLLEGLMEERRGRTTPYLNTLNEQATQNYKQNDNPKTFLTD